MFHYITLLEAAKLKRLVTYPPTQREVGLDLAVHFYFRWSWACPRPDQFPITYYHVMNNNTQSRILHYSFPLNFSEREDYLTQSKSVLLCQHQSLCCIWVWIVNVLLKPRL